MKIKLPLDICSLLKSFYFLTISYPVVSLAFSSAHFQEIFIYFFQFFLTLIWVGFLGDRFSVGGKNEPSCLKLVRIMLET